MSTTNPVIDKIRKLLAKASDPSVTEAEAASYAAKAAEMLQRAGLDMADVPESERNDEMTHEERIVKYSSNSWRRHLASSVARLYFCDLIFYPGTDRFRVVGRPHNVVVSWTMIDYLFSTVCRLSLKYRRDADESHAARCAFERGCADRLSDRLRELKANVTAPSQSGSGLPALYDQEADLVKEYLAGTKQTPKSKKIEVDVDSYHSLLGARVGDTISLSPQVASSSRSGAAMLGSK